MARANSSAMTSSVFVLLLLTHICLAQIEGKSSLCQFDKLKALQSNRQVKSDAGISDYWDFDGEDLEELNCAGMSVVRHTIYQKALLFPSIFSSPLIYYVLEGVGLHGSVIPGCTEMYESGTSKPSQYEEEQHQTVREIKHGDILALPTGSANWIYNYGNVTLIMVAFLRVSTTPPHHHHHNHHHTQTSLNGNIFGGLDEATVAKAFNVDAELASKVQSSSNGIMGDRIAYVGEDFHVLTHALMIKHEQHRRLNSLEKTSCNFQLRHNIDDPDQADIFNLEGGRISIITSSRLPILRTLQLTAERGVVYDNSMMVPHFTLNSYTLLYVTWGSGRVQVTDNHGHKVFDGELKIDDLFVVPENYVVMKEATGRSFEYISIKTSDKAIRTTLAGRVSVIRGLPDDVVAIAFGISREEAKRLKTSRVEAMLFRPSTTKTIASTLH